MIGVFSGASAATGVIRTCMEPSTRGGRSGGFLFGAGGSDGDAGELLDGAAHEFDFAEAALEDATESFLGGGEHAAVL